jgi:hypothetical protein
MTTRVPGAHERITSRAEDSLSAADADTQTRSAPMSASRRNQLYLGVDRRNRHRVLAFPAAPGIRNDSTTLP